MAFKFAYGAGHYLGTAGQYEDVELLRADSCRCRTNFGRGPLQGGKRLGAAITVSKDSIYFMNFHAGAENLDMTGTTTNEVFVYREIK